MDSILHKRFKDVNRDITVIEERYVESSGIQPNGKKTNHGAMWYKYRCSICLWDEGWMQRGKMISQKRGCSCCANKTLVKGINDFNTHYPHLVKYLKNKEDGVRFKSSSEKVELVCVECHHEKIVSLKTLAVYGYVCDRCTDGDSYPNKFTKCVLDQSKVNYIKEYSPSWISPKRYDFCIPSLKLIIEVDGQQHIKDTNFKGRKIYANEIVKNDTFKEKIANENGYKVVRVKAYVSAHKDMKESIIKSLSNIIDTLQIDWTKCEDMARSNTLKEVCLFKNRNKDAFTSEIAKIFNLSQNTISRYLAIGDEIGWCEYNPAKESNRNIQRSRERVINSANKIVVMNKDTDEILGIFDSAIDLQEKSKCLFGVELKASNTRYCCYNKSKRCNGFKVRYYKDVFNTVATTE